MSRAGRGKGRHAAKARHGRKTEGAGMPHAGATPHGGSHAAQRAAPAKASFAPEWPVVALAAVGGLITLYLTAIAWWGEAPAFCAPGSGCDVIQGSRWSVVLGLPVALWGFGVYALLGLVALRMRPGLARWRRLWNLALIGVGVSVYLTIVGIVSLDAVCGWCLASLATMSAIFGVVVWRRPAAAPGMPWPHWGLNGAVIVAVVVGLLHVYYSGLLQGREQPQLQALATHLGDSGARYYGAFWCSSCQQQRRYFGASADRLPYIECSPNGRGGAVAAVCLINDVRSFPTWVIGGQRIEGLLTPEELARLSGFEWEG